MLGSGDEVIATIAYAPNGSTAYLAVGNDNSIIPVKTSTLAAGTAFRAGLRRLWTTRSRQTDSFWSWSGGE